MVNRVLVRLWSIVLVCLVGLGLVFGSGLEFVSDLGSCSKTNVFVTDLLIHGSLYEKKLCKKPFFD